MFGIARARMQQLKRTASSTSASEIAEGVVELATDAETVTGTKTDVVTTPANITAKMAAPGAIGETTPSTIRGQLKTIIQAASDALVAAECSGCEISNYGQGGANTQTLPTAAAGLSGLVTIATAGAGAFNLKAGANEDRGYGPERRGRGGRFTSLPILPNFKRGFCPYIRG